MSVEPFPVQSTPGSRAPRFVPIAADVGKDGGELSALDGGMIYTLAKPNKVTGQLR
jgi:hypothetical protein